jgi:hypothetical protein
MIDAMTDGRYSREQAAARAGRAAVDAMPKAVVTPGAKKVADAHAEMVRDLTRSR